MPKEQRVIYVPTLRPVCQVDGKPIDPRDEPGGKLYLVKGHPMCAFHRLMRRPQSGKLDYRKVFAQRAEEERAAADQVAARDHAQGSENERVMDIAAKSQEAAAKLNPKTVNRKLKSSRRLLFGKNK